MQQQVRKTTNMKQQLPDLALCETYCYCLHLIFICQQRSLMAVARPYVQQAVCSGGSWTPLVLNTSSWRRPTTSVLTDSIIMMELLSLYGH